MLDRSIHVETTEISRVRLGGPYMKYWWGCDQVAFLPSYAGDLR